MKQLNTNAFPYTKVFVLGLAKSGSAAAHLLLDSGLDVTVNDLKADENSADITELKDKGAYVVTGSHPLHLLDDIELVVKNPGIPYENPMIKEAEKRRIPIVTEVELAGQLHEGNLIGVTGSNGKTTTTTLIYEFMKENQSPVKIAGNIGEVSCEVARTTSEDETMVVELSSFQLLGIEKFSPHIAVLLNLFEAHLDYHHSLENYHAAKANIVKNQSAEDYFVYNADDPAIVSYLKSAPSRLVPFSIKKKVDGSWRDEEAIYFKEEKIMDRKDIVLVGEHNLSNILAAIAAAKLSDVSNEAIRRVLTTFKGVEHRMEFVTKKHQIYFYNDSKATNILATTNALKAFDQPVVLLAGGLDRGNEFDELIDPLVNVKALVVFGETAQKIADAGKKAGISSIAFAETMNEAVKAAYSFAESEEVILLSPACASWDQYKTFEERGHMFKEAVHKL
ncbi:UDP-N-acetylmuramoylalanine--D-glutamate ligase [Halobacillus andaensis]|uniref:UDP-N-acetylmuramoylalanine--D-glutamate ligase n=1 Tax=Halobacillus andaensis TaxID=1176239 RepID=A0A917AZ25_HALAA|nr:UDP-N-acetylmuramoyl-L-alanine--D-glutamate ligase [Halobacillus andaensis]MBP2003585.1 UDP-N-acetylmuramoylalanine--D-glutamate ligase [Halobacillus andaensis]GGF11755.1 UDP-N-acetylmuramoylalanine--D-glutamate ligase [Halobacillus andaensis]